MQGQLPSEIEQWRLNNAPFSIVSEKDYKNDGREALCHLFSLSFFSFITMQFLILALTLINLNLSSAAGIEVGNNQTVRGDVLAGLNETVRIGIDNDLNATSSIAPTARNGTDNAGNATNSNALSNRTGPMTMPNGAANTHAGMTAAGLAMALACLL